MTSLTRSLARPSIADWDPSSQMKPGVFREEYIAIIVRELLKGLDYLHTEGKLHRDIKGARHVNLVPEIRAYSYI